MVTHITILKSLLGSRLLILPPSKICRAAPLSFVPFCSSLMMKVHRGQVSDRAQNLSCPVCFPFRDALPSATLEGQQPRQLKTSAKQPLISTISMEVPGCGCFSAAGAGC